MLTLEQRYMTDPILHKLVDLFFDEMRKGTCTPTDIREALLLASLKFENEQCFSPLRPKG